MAWEQIERVEIAPNPLMIRKTSRLRVPKGWTLLIEYLWFDANGNSRIHTENARIEDAKHEWDGEYPPAQAVEGAIAKSHQNPPTLEAGATQVATEAT